MIENLFLVIIFLIAIFAIFRIKSGKCSICKKKSCPLNRRR